MIIWSDEGPFSCDNKTTHCRFKYHAPFLQEARSLICIFLYKTYWQYFCNSILTYLLGELSIITVHVQPIIILKTDICTAYMNIHPRWMMASFLFLFNWVIRYLYFFIHWDYDYDIDIWLFAKLNSSY